QNARATERQSKSWRRKEIADSTPANGRDTPAGTRTGLLLCGTPRHMMGCRGESPSFVGTAFRRAAPASGGRSRDACTASDVALTAAPLPGGKMPVSRAEIFRCPRRTTMSVAAMIREMEQENATTRRVLERVPNDK